jgi:hypothetical protein
MKSTSRSPAVKRLEKAQAHGFTDATKCRKQIEHRMQLAQLSPGELNPAGWAFRLAPANRTRMSVRIRSLIIRNSSRAGASQPGGELIRSHIQSAALTLYSLATFADTTTMTIQPT